MSAAAQVHAEAAQAPAPDPVLRVEGLTVSVNTEAGLVPLVQDLSFTLNRGETLAIAGESGSGKSITSLAIMGLLPPPAVRITGGAIRLGDLDLVTLPESRMRALRGARIAMIFQEPMTALNPVMTVGAQLVEAIRAHEPVAGAQARARALEALRAVRLSQPDQRMGQYPHELSGGMRQRVMIAMALALRPEVLIADEPTTALDVTVQREVLDLLLDLQRDLGAAIILITHDMGVVAETADRVIVMQAGRAVETGPTLEIFARPRHDYTRSLLAAVPRIGARTAQPRKTEDSAAQPCKTDDGAARSGKTDKSAAQQRETCPSAAQRRETGDDAAQALKSSDSDPVARLSDVTVRFPLRGGVLGRVRAQVHAVEHVSLSVRRGETLSLVGESGCGKSTIARAIVGLVPHTGRIEVAGRALADLDRRGRMALRRRVQMVFQDPMAALDPRMTAGALIAEPLVIHRVGGPREQAARVADLLTRVGLSPEHAARYPHEFSGGQRQRICIARALALQPDLIIADEAVSALDVSVQARVLDLLRTVQREFGVALLFISHDMAVVENISDRVAVMYLGQIVETGTRDQVFGDPRHPYTRRLIDAAPVPDPARRRPPSVRLTGEVPSPIHPLGRGPERVTLRDVGGGHLAALG